jgi:hypothetical protein
MIKAENPVCLFLIEAYETSPVQFFCFGDAGTRNPEGTKQFSRESFSLDQAVFMANGSGESQ